MWGYTNANKAQFIQPQQISDFNMENPTVTYNGSRYVYSCKITFMIDAIDENNYPIYNTWDKRNHVVYVFNSNHKPKYLEDGVVVGMYVIDPSIDQAQTYGYIEDTLTFTSDAANGYLVGFAVSGSGAYNFYDDSARKLHDAITDKDGEYLALKDGTILTTRYAR